MALPKKNRLKGKREFSAVFSHARPVLSEHFSLRVVRGVSTGGYRIAVVVPAKNVALSSDRNRLRRRVTEAVRGIIRTYPIVPGVRGVVSVKTPHLPGADGLKRELMSLMKKSGIVTT